MDARDSRALVEGGPTTVTPRHYCATARLAIGASNGKRSFMAFAAARIVERRKGDKYKHLAAPRDARVLAFVLESYGAFGNEAVEVMKILRACLSQLSMSMPSITAKTMTEMVAICLQKGNAAVSASGSLAVRGTVHPRRE